MKLIVAIGAVCASLAGCATAPREPSAIEASLKQLIGRPLSSVVEVLGPPGNHVPPRDRPGSKGLYAWSMTQTALTGRLEFVQTGQRHVGTRQVGQVGGSHGVGAVPIIENVYQQEGYYAPQERLVSLCEISVHTDWQYTVTNVFVIGCN